ncbi:hypothetical protein GCM10010448_30590 [Streptomyces glomeratus]|uniref:Uncharacterized protein n=1 Tax=Streptomyces glomeratus TaxID=284452 RepID=A0ABP6LME6_9ACTN
MASGEACRGKAARPTIVPQRTPRLLPRGGPDASAGRVRTENLSSAPFAGGRRRNPKDLSGTAAPAPRECRVCSP